MTYRHLEQIAGSWHGKVCMFGYSKGAHSFELLAMIDSSLVVARSKWAKRLVDYLKTEPAKGS